MEKKLINADRTNQLGINNVDTMYCMHMYMYAYFMSCPTTIDKKRSLLFTMHLFCHNYRLQTGNIMSATATADKC